MENTQDIVKQLNQNSPTLANSDIRFANENSYSQKITLDYYAYVHKDTNDNETKNNKHIRKDDQRCYSGRRNNDTNEPEEVNNKLIEDLVPRPRVVTGPIKRPEIVSIGKYSKILYYTFLQITIE